MAATVSGAFRGAIYTGLLIICLKVATVAASRVRLDNDRGYIDLVVAIRDDVSEDDFPDLLDNIRSAFTSASAFLYSATRSLTRFKEVRIVIPPSWRDSNDYDIATWETYDGSDIRIEPNADNAPYVPGYAPCGSPGPFIALTPDYVVNRDTLHSTYGTPERVIVHEWGHFRWGLFDEYATDDASAFYQDYFTEKIEATRCVQAIPGKILNRETFQKCNTFVNGLPDPNVCVFVDETSSSNVYRASLMYAQYLTQITEFCDNLQFSAVQHNVYAPSDQNNFCEQKSAWEVMRMHEDFNNTGNEIPYEDTTPRFILVKESSVTTTVLVLDTSGSMEGERLVLLRQASENIIGDVLPDGDRLGIVAFSTSGRVLSSIVTVETSTRQQLINALPASTSGFTSIGSGVARGVDLLVAEPAMFRRKMIVITDGEENRNPRISSVIDEVVDNNITVCTVAVGAKADTGLEILANSTGGQHFSHTDQSSTLFVSFFQAANTINRADGSREMSTVLDADFINIPSGGNYTNRFFLDEAFTGELKVVVAYVISSSFRSDIRLTNPNGVTFDSSSQFFTNKTSFRQAEFNVNQSHVMDGYWHLQVTNNRAEDESYNVIIQPRSLPGAKPIMASTFWALSSVTPPQRQILYTIVSQDTTPVTNVNVTAIVTLNVDRENNSVVAGLRDDGAGADIRKDDGVYSAYFTKFLGSGRYGVEVKVRATDDSQLVLGAQVGRNSAINPAVDGGTTRRNITYVDSGNFQREVIGGSFECLGDICDNTTADFYPPARIQDLSATHVDPTNNTLTLTFTSPGDDLSDGTASKYEIHYSTHFTLLLNEFNDTDLVPSDWLVQGDVNMPAPAGTREEFIIRVNETGSITYTFAIVAIDDEDNQSERSNIVTSSGSLLIVSSNRISTTLIIVIVVLVVVFLVALSLAIVVYIVKRRQRQNGNKA